MGCKAESFCMQAHVLLTRQDLQLHYRHTGEQLH
jgi:hypothetical protein